MYSNTIRNRKRRENETEAQCEIRRTCDRVNKRKKENSRDEYYE